MTRKRFFVPRDSIRGGIATLPPDQAYHLRHVLRLGTGDVVEFFDGEGGRYIGEVELHGPEVWVRRLQKATELGVEEIIPLKTRFSDIRIPDSKIDIRLERWGRIVQEASKQCRRPTVPRVRKPIQFSDFLCLKELSASTRLLFFEKAADLPRLESVLSDRIVLCIGPEGGWDSNEIEQARETGYKTFSLGPWILRAETAALAAVSIIQFQISGKISDRRPI